MLNGVFRVHWDDGYLHERSLFGYTHEYPLSEAFIGKCESLTKCLEDDGYSVEVKPESDGKSVRIFGRRNPKTILADKIIKIWIEKDKR